MAWHERERPAENWKTLREQLFDVAESDSIACRGQPHDYGEGMLFSSIDRAFRDGKIDGPLAIAIERNAIERFLQQAPNYLPIAEQDHFKNGPSLLMLMRHYGGPTRLLDWSESLWIAAFNAANGEWDKTGTIWVFDRHRFDQLVHERHGNQTDWAHRSVVVPWLAAELPAVTVFHLDRWVCRLFGIGPRIPRVIAQQGMFTIASRLDTDHAAFIDHMLPTTSPPCTHIIRISVPLKPQVLKELAKMGITASALFPGVDGVGRYLESFVRFAPLDSGVKACAQGVHGRLFSPPAPSSPDSTVTSE